MKLTMMNTRQPSRKQKGAAALEFGLVALVFLLLLLGIVEFGRLLFVFNTVQEVTRRAAREAVVSEFDADRVDELQRISVFHEEDSSGVVNLPGSPEVSNLRVQIDYLNESMALADPLPDDPADNIGECVAHTNSCIAFVQARVCVVDGNECTPVDFLPASGLFGFLGVGVPLSTVVMPAESMGFRLD